MCVLNLMPNWCRLQSHLHSNFLEYSLHLKPPNDLEDTQILKTIISCNSGHIFQMCWCVFFFHFVLLCVHPETALVSPISQQAVEERWSRFPLLWQESTESQFSDVSSLNRAQWPYVNIFFTSSVWTHCRRQEGVLLKSQHRVSQRIA